MKIGDTISIELKQQNNLLAPHVRQVRRQFHELSHRQRLCCSKAVYKFEECVIFSMFDILLLPLMSLRIGSRLNWLATLMAFVLFRYS